MLFAQEGQKSLRAYHEKAPGGVKMAIARRDLWLTKKNSKKNLTFSPYPRKSPPRRWEQTSSEWHIEN